MNPTHFICFRAKHGDLYFHGDAPVEVCDGLLTHEGLEAVRRLLVKKTGAESIVFVSITKLDTPRP